MFMEEEVRKDILSMLRAVYTALEDCDANGLKTASDFTLHNSSTYQDRDSVSISVVVYSLYKICSRERLKENEDFLRFKREFLNLIKRAEKDLNKNRTKKYEIVIKRMYKLIAGIEKEFGMYVTQVVNQSRIKKGGRMFEHGVSAGRAAELLGISSWELMNYIGNTKLSDVRIVKTEDVKERIKYAKGVFGL